MKHGCTALLLGLCFFCCRLALGQQQYDFQFRNDVKIVIDSDTLKNPWAGGFNSPVFSKIELNNDGTEDLFIYDRSQEKIFTYLAQRTNGQWYWQYAPQYEALFPDDLTGWVLLRDYDRDGRKDIFTKTNAGIKVYRNTTATNGKLTFAVAEPFIKFNGNANLQVSSENLPAILDVDNDGDLDILTFDFSGSSIIEYYINQQIEQNLAADKLTFTLTTSGWGGFRKCEHVCNSFVFNGSCRTYGTLHNDGVTLLALDLDGDADKDILVGVDACTDLIKIRNSGTPGQVAMTGTDVQLNFPGNTTRASFPFFPAAYYEDVTFDDKKDLLVAPFALNNTNNQEINFSNSAWLYQNTNATGNPVFDFRQNDFLQEEMVDVGENSTPALADLDADGDLDMLVGNSRGSIWAFRNVGTPARKVFKLETTDYLDIASQGLKNLKPQFVDLNTDGKLDLILTATANNSTSIKYMLNTAASGQPLSFSTATMKTLPVSLFGGDVPAFYDLDRDGDKDLVLATKAASGSGTLSYYANTGTNANPAYTLKSAAFGGILADFFRQNNFILFTDLNKDNNPELLLGDDSGEIRVYSNFLHNIAGDFTGTADILKNTNTGNFEPTRLGYNLAFAAADLDGDQIPEIIAGSRGGGLYYFGQTMRGPIVPVITVAENDKYIVYPNPAQVAEQVMVKGPEPFIITMYTVTGQLVFAQGEEAFSQSHVVEVANLKPGMYLVQLRTRNNARFTQKLIIYR